MALPKSRAGRPRYLNSAELELLERILAKGPKGLGRVDARWKTPDVSKLIETCLGIRYGPRATRGLMLKLGWEQFGAGIIWEAKRSSGS